MESIFDNDSYLFDPSSSSQYETSNFLSFSSFSEQLSTWEDFNLDYKEPPARSVSDASSPTLSEPFEFPSSSFDPITPAETSQIGIFHTPEKKFANAGQDQTAFFSHRSSGSGSTDSWGEPTTPSLSGKSFAALSGNNFTPSQSTPGFSWDEATPTFSGSSYTPPTPAFQAQPHRVTSNPVLSTTSRQPRTLNKPASMPVLKEEETPSSQWLDGTSFLEAPLEIPNAAADVSVDAQELDDFVWNLNDQTLGFDNFPTEDTIFAAFNEPTNAIPMMHSHSHTGVFPSQTPEFTFNPSSFQSDYPSWMSGLPATQDVVGLGQFDLTSLNQNQQMGLLPAFTIDPSTIMGTNGGMVDENSSRPSSAPGLNGGEESKGMLSVPTADVMTRSLSSEGFVPSRHAPPRDLFSYAPQPIPSGPPGPQPLYTSDPSPSYQQLAPSALSYGMPPTPTRSSSRKMSNSLSIKIHPPAYSTFVPSPFPPTPQSATFPTSLAAAQSQSQQQQPIAMQRAGTQPLPQTRKLSGAGVAQPGLPAHLARAQAIVQQQAAREEAERDSIRREAASRRVGMAEASVMQPTISATSGKRTQPAIMGWEGPSAQTGSLPVLTHTPLVTIHPPPAQYLVTGAPIPVHRVHPPPHPGNGTAATGQPRQIARLPSSPARLRKASSSNQLTPTRTTPKSRSPSSATKRKASAAGGFTFADPFINFTADDAQKLLSGVAPSGSQSKRKREEEAAAKAAAASNSSSGEEDEARSKRSKSNE